MLLPIIKFFFFLLGSVLYLKLMYRNESWWSTVRASLAMSSDSRDNLTKEVFVDLIAAQIKILSFLAYIIKTFQDRVAQHCDELVKGMLQLLELCPSEVAHLRKELLIATKHILALELRVSE